MLILAEAMASILLLGRWRERTKVKITTSTSRHNGPFGVWSIISRVKTSETDLAIL